MTLLLSRQQSNIILCLVLKRNLSPLTLPFDRIHFFQLIITLIFKAIQSSSKLSPLISPQWKLKFKIGKIPISENHLVFHLVQNAINNSNFSFNISTLPILSQTKVHKQFSTLSVAKCHNIHNISKELTNAFKNKNPNKRYQNGNAFNQEQKKTILFHCKCLDLVYK